MRNKMDLLGGYLNGLNLNPIPLEFGQSLSTTKELAMILAKIDQVITFTNDWYTLILDDLEKDGVLYQKIISEFSDDISLINNNITNLSDLITLLQYTKPLISLTSSPSNYTYEVGDIINSIMLNYNITKGSNNLVKAEIYKNGSLLTTITNLVNGINNYVDGTAITSDTSYYIKVYDDKGFVQSNEIKFTFTYKAFYGKIADNVTVTEALIQTLNNVNLVDNFSFNVSLSDEKIIIVTHENLSSIIDSDNFDMIESFTVSTMNLNINNISIPYNIYVSTNTILDANVNLIIEK
jgi:hypothetical protein